MLQRPKPKYDLNQVVDLAAPTVLIVGITFNSGGPDGPVNVCYDILHDGEIQRMVPESAITGINEEAQRKQEAHWDARRQEKAFAAAAEQQRERVLVPSKLGAAIGGGLEHSRGLNGADVVEGAPIGDLAARREARDAENDQPAPVEDPDLVRN